MNEYTCDKCGAEMEFNGSEWAKYGDRYEEELVAVYECTKCKETIAVRNRSEIVSWS